MSYRTRWLSSRRVCPPSPSARCARGSGGQPSPDARPVAGLPGVAGEQSERSGEVAGLPAVAGERSERFGEGWALALVLIAGLGALAALIFVRGDPSDDIEVRTAEVTSGTIARQVMVTGTLQPTRTVEVGSQVSGTIASIAADFNTPVRAGQVLARLDPSGYEARLVEAEAKVVQAQGEYARIEAALEDARTKRERAEGLAADELMPRAELDLARTTAKQATAALRAAEADIAAAQAAVTQARVSLNHTTIRSPIDGVVVSRHVEEGQTVAASVQTPVLFTIADLRRMQMLAEVAEADVGGVRQGSPVTFQIESLGDRRFEGTVAAVRLQPVRTLAATSNPSTAATAAPVGASPATSTSASTSSSASAGQPSSTTGSTPSSSDSSRTQTAGATSAAQPATASGTTSVSGSTNTSASSGSTSAGVVTYTAVIDVDNASGTIPPGGTAIITLGGGQRANVIRVPNSALNFRPSDEAFAAIGQEPPVLQSKSSAARGKLSSPTRHGFVWKFENERFVPIAVETGLADDSWMELVSGAVAPGDKLLVAASAARSR